MPRTWGSYEVAEQAVPEGRAVVGQFHLMVGQLLTVLVAEPKANGTLGSGGFDGQFVEHRSGYLDWTSAAVVLRGVAVSKRLPIEEVTRNIAAVAGASNPPKPRAEPEPLGIHPNSC